MAHHPLLWIGTASLMAIASMAGAQDKAAPATPDAPIEASKSAIPPGADYLSRRYGISMDEAALRINLQAEIAELVKQVQADTSADIAGIWVQQTPVFKIVIGFTDPDDKKLVRYQIDPKIRRYAAAIFDGRRRRGGAISGRGPTNGACIHCKKLPFTFKG